MATLAIDVLPPEASPGRRALRRLAVRPSAMVGLGVVVFFVLLAIFAPWIAPYDPIATSWSAIRKAPSAAHWFGTDEIGRDVLSRVIFGARASLLAGVVSVSIALALGVPIGLLAGYAGRWPDALISRMTDAMLATPFLILAIALAAFLGPSLTNAMIAIGISATPIFIRLTRASVQSVKVEDYVEAARAVGNSHPRIAGAPRAAERAAAADRAGDADDRRRGHRRGEPVVPRIGPAAARSRRGAACSTPRRTTSRTPRGWPCGRGCRSSRSCSRLVQPAGRRAARRARPAARLATSSAAPPISCGQDSGSGGSFISQNGTTRLMRPSAAISLIDSPCATTEPSGPMNAHPGPHEIGERHETAREDEAAAGPVAMERGDLLRDRVVAGEAQVGTPDLAVLGHAPGEQFAAAAGIVLGEGFEVDLEDGEECGSAHGEPLNCFTLSTTSWLASGFWYQNIETGTDSAFENRNLGR
jgi:ABC-type nitrate/sulfonate/bicarbonate transport system permease component